MKISDPKWKWLDWSSLVIIILVLLSPSLFYDAWIGSGVDLFGTIWFYGWVEYCISNWMDPSFTDWFFYPNGKDIFAHTGSNLLDALLSVPFQWILGDNFFGWFIGTLILSNLFGLRKLLSELGVGQFAIWIASVAWVLNPYIISELNMGRPTQILLLPSFMSLLYLHRICIGIGTLKDSILMGVWVAIQGWCYWFYGFFLVGFMIAVSIGYAVQSTFSYKDFASRSLFAVMVSLVIVSPAVFIMVNLDTGGSIPGRIDTSGSLSEITQQLVPWIRGYHIHRPLGHPVLRTFLLGGMLAALVLFGRKQWVWIFPLVLMWCIGLGPLIPLSDTSLMNLPYVLMLKVVPFWDRLWFPYRAMGFFSIALILWFAIEVNSSKWIHSSRLRFVLGLVVVLSGVFDATWVRSVPLVSTTRKTNSVLQCIDAPMIEIPIGFAHSTMMFQAKHRQPTFGGMGENGLIFLPDGFSALLQNPFIQTLKSKSLIVNSTKTYTELDQQRIKSAGFRYVLWDRSMTENEHSKREVSKTRPKSVFDIQQNLIEILGSPVCWDSELVLFDISGNDAPVDGALLDWSWSPPKIDEYEQRLRQLNRIPN